MKKVLLILGALFVVGAAVAGTGVYLILRYTGEPVKVVRAQLDAINRNNYLAAYNYCSSAFKQNTSAPEFAVFLESNPVMKTSDSTFSNRSINNGVATIQGTLTGRNGQVVTVKYTLVRERDQWVIQHIKLGGEAGENTGDQ